ncbi:MAG: response regulator [Alphaproteobacteria bacterium]|jgi:CheY-like chemotaxis protein|nr:response regulator [Alphaproteobacteria bacterium]
MPDYNFENLHVLVIDDNQYMLSIMRTILAAMGVRRVQCASDARAALETLGDVPPDIVITDWLMEPMDGLEFTRAVRASEDDAVRFLPIVMLTAFSEKDRVAEVRDCGVTEVLAKPVSPEAIYKRFVATIDNPRPYVESKIYFGPDRRRQEKAFDGDDKRDEAEDLPAAAEG